MPVPKPRLSTALMAAELALKNAPKAINPLKRLTPKQEELFNNLQLGKKLTKAENVELGLYHGIGGGKKLTRPISEMGIKSIDNPNMPLLPQKTIKFEDMVGGAGVPLTVDRSGAGKIIQKVGNQPLIRDVPTQGGIDYTRWNEAFASLPNVANRYGNQIVEASKMKGVDPDKIFGLSNLMSHTGVDFSHQPMEVLLNQFDPTLLDKKRVKEFNTAVQNHPVVNQKTKKVTYPFKNFAGIETPEGRYQLLETSNYGGELRKNVMHKMNLDDFADMQFPSIAEARTAITEPRLLDEPTASVGHNVARFNPEGIVTYETDKPHYSYTGVIKGHPTEGGYAGEAEQTLPMQDVFQQYFDIRRALSKPEGSDLRALSMSIPIQKFDNEWLDRIKTAQEKKEYAIKNGLPFKDGGKVPEGTVTLDEYDPTEDLKKQQEEPEVYTDPMGNVVPSINTPSLDEMKYALSKVPVQSYMEQPTPYKDPMTGAVVQNPLEALPAGYNKPTALEPHYTPIDYANLPKEPIKSVLDPIAGALEAGTTLGTGALASMVGLPYEMGRSILDKNQNFDENFKNRIENNTYIPRSQEGLDILEGVDKVASGLPPMPELMGLEPLMSSATSKAMGMGAKGAKVAGKEVAKYGANKLEDFLHQQGLISNVVPESKVLIQPHSPKDEFGFYSKLEKEAQNIQRKQGNGQAFLNDLKKLQVKPHELEATGMDEFLKSKNNFTRDEVIDFAKQNRPVIKEKLFSRDLSNIKAEEIPLKEYTYIADSQTPLKSYDITHNNNHVTIMHKIENDDGSIKYYVEGLDDDEPFTNKEDAIKAIQGHMEDFMHNLGKEDATSLPKYEEDYRTEGGENYRELLVTLPNAKEKFTQGHYSDYPNTMINMRLDDRIDVDGKKGTLIDELQSDWHQSGKEHGYNQMDESSWFNYLDDLNKRFSEYANTKWKKHGKKFIEEQIQFTPASSKATILNEQKLYRDNYKKVINKIPNAPYKENWYELGLKKAIQHAVERGDDRVYLSTGQTLADRYSLEKNFSEIHLSGSTLVGYDHQGNEIVKRTGVTKEELPDLIGKEASKKLLEQEPKGTLRSLTGLDLRVGGEGMKKYYDEIYPSYLKRFAKQYGGHVGETELPTPHKNFYSGNDMKAHYGLNDEQWKELHQNGKYDELRQDYENYRKNASTKVYYYEPSAEAKKKITGGLPYKDGGEVKGYEGGGSVETDPNQALQAHMRQFLTPDLLDVQDIGVTGRTDDGAVTIGRQVASKNLQDENPNMRYKQNMDYGQYSTPFHEGQLNARVMKDPQKPDIQAMLQYLQSVGKGTAGIGLMGNRTSEGDKLRALNMMYNQQIDPSSDVSGMVTLPFGQSPMVNVQYRKRFADGGEVFDPMGNTSNFTDTTAPEFQPKPKPVVPFDYFPHAFNYVQGIEGGFNNLKSDKPTNYGIPIDTYSRWLKRPATVEDVKNMPVEHAQEILKNEYWKPIEKYNLPPKERFMAFDTAVNQGLGTAKKIINQTGGDYNKMIEARKKAYAEVIRKNPKKKVNEKGWDKRVVYASNYEPPEEKANGGMIKMAGGGSIAKMALELAQKQPKKIIVGAERQANLEKFLQGNHPKVPNVVYHATRATPKDQAINQFVGSKSGTLGSGVYTSPNTDYVSTYTGIPTPKVIEELKTSFPAMARPFVKAQEEGDFSGIPMGGYMMPLHPSLRNPLILEGSTPDPSYEALLKLGVPEHKIEGIVDKANERTGSIGKEIQSRAQKLGHDGVMYFKNGDLQEMVTYNPTQLKSATGNKGTFDPTNPELNKKNGGKVSIDEMKYALTRKR